MKKVSVIIPTYNRARFLRKAVDSVIAQGYLDIEIIIVDDRSTDNTVEVVSDLRKQHENLIYCVSDRAQGPSGARNAGLVRATGDYISFLDSDDVWLPGHLPTGVDFLESHPEIDVLFGNYEVVDYHSGVSVFKFFDKKRVLFTLPTTKAADKVWAVRGNVFEALIQENFFHLGSSIVARRVLPGVLFDERVSFAEDSDFAVQLFMKNHARFAYRKDPSFILYKHGENLTSTQNANGRSQLAHILLFTDYLAKYAKTDRQKAMLHKKISENLLERSYTSRLEGDHILALGDLMKSTLHGFSWTHPIEVAKIFRSVLMTRFRKTKVVAKAVLPRRTIRALRTMQREYTFRRAMETFLRDPEIASISIRELDDLVYGWGNEGFSSSEKYLAACMKHALACEGPILECGSGLTTVLLGVIAQNRGKELWTLEHLPAWSEKVKRCLKVYRIDSVHLQTRPLKAYGEFSWYEPELDSMPESFDLVICDGPPGNTHGGRYGLMPVMQNKLRPGCTVLLDDTGREQEKNTALRWVKEFGATYEASGPNDPFARMVLKKDEKR